ncbi:hypothetical protein N2152v2_007243 [Parachlorella kessleri]
MAHTLGSHVGLLGASLTHQFQLAVSLRDEGIIVYDTRTQKPVKTWALGLPNYRLASSPAFDRSSQQLFVAAQPASDGNSANSILLSWHRKADVGSLRQTARQAQLPAAVHSLHPLPTQAAARPQQDADAAAAMDVDAAEQPALFAVYVNGAVAACSPAGVAAENMEARGLQPLAATATDDSLVVVHVDPRAGGATCSSYQLQDGKVQCGPIVQLSPPQPDSTALAAVSTTGRTAVLWSSGTLAVYDSSTLGGSSSSSSGQLPPQLCRRLRGFALPQRAQQQQVMTPQNGKLHRNSKKRGHGSSTVSGSGAAQAVSLTALGTSGLLAVVGWSSENPGEAAVRVVVLDCVYGCVQAALDLSASDVGAPSLDPSQPVQGRPTPSGCVTCSGRLASPAGLPLGLAGTALALGDSGQLALVAGGSLLLAELQLRPPTLANLIGALCLSTPATRRGTDPASALFGEVDTHAAAANPCAAAAAAALHESELASLAGPPAVGSAAPAPVHFVLELETQQAEHAQRAHSSDAQQLVQPAVVRWSEPSSPALQAAERVAWDAVLDRSASGNSDASGAAAATSGIRLQQAVQQLLLVSQQHGVPLSQRLLSRLLQAAAGLGQWDCLGELVAAQHPGSLAACPGLVPALASAHQYPLLQLLLSQASDVSAADVAGTLRGLLGRAHSDDAKQAQRAYLAGARAAAEAAVVAVERAAAAEGGRVPDQLLAVAACCAAAVEGFSAAQVCLHPLVAIKHDASALLGALRQLSTAEALALLRYLRTLLTNFAQLVGDRYLVAAGAGLPATVVLPHPAAVLEWAGAAMDANMARLVLHREAGQVLSEMRGLVEGQLRSLRRLSQVHGVLQQAQRGAGALPAVRATAAAKYTLEWLDLRVL